MKKTQIDFLNKLKQHSIQKKTVFKHKYSSCLTLLLELLYKEGLILSYNIADGFAYIYVREYEGMSGVKNLRILATSSKKIFVRYKNLTTLSTKTTNIFLSTDKGLFSIIECKKHKLGGVLLFSC